MFSLLPLAGHLLAPSPWLAAVPFLALFIGAVVATFPASILTDAFGRRAAFGLGASLGIAGGLVVAWGLVHAAFWPLVVGAFWIGTANGFALQYRHAAAAGGDADAARAVAIVIGAGALIGLRRADARRPRRGQADAVRRGGERPDRGGRRMWWRSAAALLLPAAADEPAAAPGSSLLARGDWLRSTAVAAAAWFGMMAVMAFAPIGLAGCGVGFSATVGAVAWHLVAMYAPALALGLSVERLGAPTVAGAGLGLVGLAVVGARRSRPVRRRSCWPSLPPAPAGRSPPRPPSSCSTAIVRRASRWPRTMRAFCRPESPARWSRDSYSDPGVGWAKARQRRAHASYHDDSNRVGTALARLCPPYNGRERSDQRCTSGMPMSTTKAAW